MGSRRKKGLAMTETTSPKIKSENPKIQELMVQKLEAREQLRAARVAIAKIDTKLHIAGASIVDINAVCW